MTQDEIIEMAKQAGFWKEHTNTWMCNSQDIEAFAKLVAQHEREACAQVCDDLADMHAKMNQWGSHKTADTLADAIRARGQE
jgi:hypothetical protein